MATGWISERMLKAGVGPGSKQAYTVSGNVPARAFVKRGSSGVVAVASTNEIDSIGISTSDEAVINGEEITVAYEGKVTAVADVAISAGDLIKVGYLGTAHPALTLSKSGVSIGSSVGGGFANQPANDAIEVGSSSAADTMTVTLYGTTNGGLTVVTETVTLTGTTFVTTTKTDWGVLLGFEIPEGQPTAAGTITVREASGNATISTLAAGSRLKGVVNVTAANQRAFNHIVGFTADSGTTKNIGIIGTSAAGATVREAIAATGATEAQFTNSFKTVSKLLVGDLESARTGTFKTDLSIDGSAFIVGIALETAVAGAEFEMQLFERPKGGVRNLYTQHTASIDVSGVNTDTAFNRSISIPASVLVPGRQLVIRAQGIQTGANATDTASYKIKVGSTALVTSPAIDGTANDIISLEGVLIPRAAAGATASCVGFGRHCVGVVNTATTKDVLLAATNFATNGALAVTVTAVFGSTNTGNVARLDNLIVDIVD